MEKKIITHPVDAVVMLDCPDCLELLSCLKRFPISWEMYPIWYREGKRCPGCGAGYIGDFGTRKISST